MNGESRPPAGRAALSKGGAEGTRTPDPHTASVVRYQLRHSPLPTRSGVSEPSTTIQADRGAPGTGVGRVAHPPRTPPTPHETAGPAASAAAQADGIGVICATRIELPNGSRKPKSMP